MNPELSNAIKQAALEFWIDYNYEVAQGRKEGEEWLDEEEEDDESIIQYRKEIEEGCPEGYKTVWNSHGFRYEEEE